MNNCADGINTVIDYQK